jgi:hypothetical protein
MFDRYITVDWSASSSPKTGQNRLNLCVCAVGWRGAEDLTANLSDRNICKNAAMR